MQFLHAAAAFSLVATVFANSGFVETCPMIQMVDDHNIQASCYGPDGLELTVLDLNQCIANLNGQLVQQEKYVNKHASYYWLSRNYTNTLTSGNFADSCEACAADYDGTMWCSKCGDSHNVGIDLSKFSLRLMKLSYMSVLIVWLTYYRSSYRELRWAYGLPWTWWNVHQWRNWKHRVSLNDPGLVICRMR